MTNWCQNRLTITGSKEHLIAFAQACLGSGARGNELDFEKIRPLPPCLRGATCTIASTIDDRFIESISAGILGIEVAIRAPIKRPGARDPVGVLDNARVQALGIKSDDDLERWTRKHGPEAFEIGRKCLRAFETTGYYFEEDWIDENWGCHPNRVMYDHYAIEEIVYHADFASAWSAPEGVFREIARSQPALQVRAVSVEEGNDYCYILTSSDGSIVEDHPDMSDAIIEEVDGAGEIAKRDRQQRLFFDVPSELRAQPMRHFRYWWREARLKKRLAG